VGSPRASAAGAEKAAASDRLPSYVPSVPLTAAAVLNCAYLELLQWSGEHVYPEVSGASRMEHALSMFSTSRAGACNQ